MNNGFGLVNSSFISYSISSFDFRGLYVFGSAGALNFTFMIDFINEIFIFLLVVYFQWLSPNDFVLRIIL